ncbi:MAG: hypothetical protein ACRDOL_28830 [Streptosporangiaceae bacterium]
MLYIGYAFTGMTEFFRYLLHMELTGAIAGAACTGACCAIRTAWHLAGPARRHRKRAEAALRAEVTRGLTDIQRYLRERSADAVSRKPDTPSGGNDSAQDAETRTADRAGDNGEMTG